MSTVSARRFNQAPSVIKELAKREPVFVTERGRTALVVISAEEYERLSGWTSTHATLRMDDDVDVDFEPVISRDPVRPAKL